MRINIFSFFLTGLALALLLGIFFWSYSIFKTIYVIDELTDQNSNNKEVFLSQTAGSQDMENLSQPGETAATLAPSEKVEKALLPIDTVSAVGAKPIKYNEKISKQTPISGELVQPVSGQAAGKKGLQTAASADQNLNNSAENTSTAEISTFNGNTSENFKSVRAAELYQQTIVNQQKRNEEKDRQTVATNSNDPGESLAESSKNSVAEQNTIDMYDQVVSLRLEIERLNERIENGMSDSDYDFYTQLKSPVYVIHDRERLEYYQEILDKMLLDMTNQ